MFLTSEQSRISVSISFYSFPTELADWWDEESGSMFNQSVLCPVGVLWEGGLVDLLLQAVLFTLPMINLPAVKENCRLHQFHECEAFTDSM